MSIITVSDGFYEKSSEDLTSGGVGPCFVLGALADNTGYLFHHQLVGKNYEKVTEPFFEDVKAISPANLELFLIGGQIHALDSDDTRTQIRTVRKYLLTELEQANLTKRISLLHWAEPEGNQCLTLYPRTGKYEYSAFDEVDEETGWPLSMLTEEEITNYWN